MVVHGPAAALGRCSLGRIELLQGAMSGTGTKRVSRAAALHTPGFAVTVLPASPYEVSYVPDHHVIGFTFEGQRGVDAFGGSRRRRFDAEPWRLAFTPAGCDVFSASNRGGEYLLLSIAPETFSRLAPRIMWRRLSQFTNVADPLFTPLAIGLRRAALLRAATPLLSIEIMAAAAVERVSAALDAGTTRARPERRMTSRSELFVIARNSSFQYKGKAVDVRQVGRELGVRYVLEGSVREGHRGLQIVVVRLPIAGRLSVCSFGRRSIDQLSGDANAVTAPSRPF